MAQLLNQTEIQQNLESLPGWTLQDNAIESVRTFKDFVEAIAFVNRLVEPAESAGHHPDLFISYNKVKISLTTHDAGGLTSNDFEMANVISGIS
jgi:4a-hydroxytetrahydrobiopterin dehydratase